jgi:hypothetical protein
MSRASAIVLFTWPLAAIAAGGDLPVQQDAVSAYQRRAERIPATCASGERVALAVAADPPVEAAYDATTGRLRLRYRMFFNDLTEGWNWHPLEAAAGGDYYAFKFLPLASRVEEGGSYPVENGMGQPNSYDVRWRTDYFFAFDNPYDFYARGSGDDAGFAAEIDVPAAEAERLMRGGLRMALRGRLHADCLADSTTFWKATVAAPVDFTLKKRYLIGRLEQVWFMDAASDKILAPIGTRGAEAGR